MAEKHKYQPPKCLYCYEPIRWAKHKRDPSVTRGTLGGCNDIYEVTRIGWREHRLSRVTYGMIRDNRILLGTYDSFKLARTAAELHRHMTNHNFIVCKQPY